MLSRCTIPLRRLLRVIHIKPMLIVQRTHTSSTKSDLQRNSTIDWQINVDHFAEPKTPSFEPLHNSSIPFCLQISYNHCSSMAREIGEAITNNRNHDALSLLDITGIDVKDYFGNGLLHVAASTNSTKMIFELVENGAKVNELNHMGLTPLFYAAAFNRPDNIYILAALGANLYERDLQSFTPMHYAAYNNATQAVRALGNLGVLVDARSTDMRVTPLMVASSIATTSEIINLGADLKATDKDGFNSIHLDLYLNNMDDNDKRTVMLARLGVPVDPEPDMSHTALNLAARSNLPNTVKALAKLRAVTHRDGVMGPFTVAVMHGHKNMLEPLAQAGVNIEARWGRQAETPLMYAALSGNVEIARILVNLGANLEAHCVQGLTALAKAAVSNHADMVVALIQLGANINGSGLTFTPLDFAISENNEAVALDLVRFGAKLIYRDGSGRNTVCYAADSKPKSISLFKKMGYNLNAPSNDGRTPIFFAGSTESIVELVANGAKLDVKDTDGDSVLVCAIKTEKSPEVIQTLIEYYNADDSLDIEPAFMTAYRNNLVGYLKLFIPSRVNQENAPLFMAVIDADTEKVRLLLKEGANVNAKDKTGRMPLYYSWDRTCLQLLLDAGSNIHNKDANGDTPLHAFAYTGNKIGVSLVLERGADKELMNNKGYKPIHIAWSAGDMIDVLTGQKHWSSLLPKEIQSQDNQLTAQSQDATPQLQESQDKSQLQSHDIPSQPQASQDTPQPQTSQDIPQPLASKDNPQPQTSQDDPQASKNERITQDGSPIQENAEALNKLQTQNKT